MIRILDLGSSNGKAVIAMVANDDDGERVTFFACKPVEKAAMLNEMTKSLDASAEIIEDMAREGVEPSNEAVVKRLREQGVLKRLRAEGRRLTAEARKSI